MSRVVIHSATSPSIVKTKSGDTVAICRCGLTTNIDGTCCGNHHKTSGEAEDKLYQYNDKLERVEIEDDCCEDGACTCDCEQE